MMGELAMDRYYVYIVTDKNKKKLETGLSGALSIRLRELELNEKNHSSFCTFLIYWESYGDAAKAMSRNEEVKKMSKKKKTELINSTNPQWLFLNDDIYKAHEMLIINPQMNAKVQGGAA